MVQKDTLIALWDTLSSEEYFNSPSLHTPDDSLITRDDSTFYKVSRGDSLAVVERYDTLFLGEDAYDVQDATTTWWTAGIDFHTNIYGIFPLKVGPITGIRHTITPRVGYTIVPEEINTFRYPGILPSARATDRQQNLTFSLDNNFDARIQQNKDQSPRRATLLNTSLRGQYNLEAEEEKFSPIDFRATIPHSHLSLTYRGRYTPYNTSQELIFPEALSHDISFTPSVPGVSGDIWSGDLFTFHDALFPAYLGGAHATDTDWSLDISPTYRISLRRDDIDRPFQQEQTYTLSTRARFRFSHRWQMQWSGRWSFQENNFINQEVSLLADLNSWDLRVQWNPTGVNSGHINMIVAVKRHREIKWEHDRI
ncbi:putative LPS assembly protein LptD [Chitinivibrio alkaliphilus]|uniref:Organic solvent tolerance protein OstA-like protein n=1 Tax=Chitinivibrio alkaliphilus ACht1 TaxID=1313304 RepID=U7D812_9BACT|nr:putative LPS assembly protein LptD [Chitinivibrio alkaliphilus]ERP31711.1 Organic solvent tolerance protein OstA-like protein [Chitinivibrio alkaliphilus ACht1]